MLPQELRGDSLVCICVIPALADPAFSGKLKAVGQDEAIAQPTMLWT